MEAVEKKHNKQKIETVGKKYGFLTVIEDLGKKLLCKCDCGNTKEIFKHSVTSGATDNCGCKRRARLSASCMGRQGPGKIDVIGKRYGLLTVIEDQGKDILCKCDCGNTKIVSRKFLISGRIENCGCQSLARREATCQAKYGATNVSKIQDIQDKKKETCKEKYGAETWFASEAGKEAVKQGIRDTYGVDHSSQIEAVKEKKKQTTLRHYGVENPMHSEEILEAKRKSHFAKYGCDAPMQRSIVRQRTMRFRNGKYVWPSALPENREKTISAMIKKYGTSQMMDLPEKRKLAALNSAKANAMGISKDERRIRIWVESLGVGTEHTAINGTYLDIWVPSRKIAIEYHGSVWHSVDGPNLTDKKRRRLRTLHKDKQLSAERDGYRLIQIWEPWWKYRQEQVKSYLKAALGVCSNRVGARDLLLREAPYKDANVFFETYHILGGRNSILKSVGLYTEDGVLIACAAFSNGTNNTNEITMSRWCVREDWIVAGGLSRVTSWATKNYQCDIFTMADLAISDGHGYEASGWEVVSTWYDYFYVNKKIPYCIPKRQRSKVRSQCPHGMTEYEWARKNGYMRIYDAGKRKYVYRYKN